jgi:hypothetical protein
MDKVNGMSINLGYYSDPIKAHDAYMKAARLHFGDHAQAK